MKIISKKYLDQNFSDEEYVWYACYGSNINYDRFMYYIRGDETEKYSTKAGCKDKNEPLEFKKYVFKCPIYFAGYSKRWGGGMAFLDYQNSGHSFGKIYKIKVSQFKGILEQEQRCKLYDAIVYVDNVESLAVFTFTAKEKLNDLNSPSHLYCQVIKEGLLQTYKELTITKINQYFKDSSI
ncbi:MAG: hypothetical protein RSA10_01090 [Bacilli bacterium]